MPAGKTYTPIARTTLSSTATTVTLSNIPQTYTDLILVCNVKSTNAGDVFVQFNSDTGSNYSATFLYGTGSTAGSFRTSNQSRILIDYYAEIFTDWSDRIVQLQNYSNTTTNKTVLVRASNAGRGVDGIAGLWRSTAAITSITVSITNSLSFAVGSTFTLYGILAA
jgi:3-keto-L-gulonate-6-phosphate decarboxylase